MKFFLINITALWSRVISFTGLIAMLIAVLFFIYPYTNIQAQTTAQCKPLIESFITPDGENNSKDVTRLQVFLSIYAGMTNLRLSGIYDEATQNTVKVFQQRYANEILVPWGIKQPTGRVYITTKKKINELFCEKIGLSDKFSLSEIEKKEITSYKTLVMANPVIIKQATTTTTVTPPIITKNTVKPTPVKNIKEAASSSKPVIQSTSTVSTVASTTPIAVVKETKPEPTKEIPSSSNQSVGLLTTNLSRQQIPLITLFVVFSLILIGGGLFIFKRSFNRATPSGESLFLPPPKDPEDDFFNFQ